MLGLGPWEQRQGKHAMQAGTPLPSTAMGHVGSEAVQLCLQVVFGRPLIKAVLQVRRCIYMSG